MGNGKRTENWAVQQLERQYGTDVDIIRLLDKFDTGRFQDVRPSDFILIFSSQNELPVVYLESKESEAKSVSFSFSTLRQGQLQAMARATRMRVNYFVIYRNLTHDRAFLIPAIIILAAKENGIKSMNAEALDPFIWRGEKLYNVFGETQ